MEALRAQLAALDLPDVIPNVTEVEAQLATVDRPQFFGWSPEALLRLAGYHACTYTDFDSLSLYYIEDDEWQANRTPKTVWSRTALAVPTVAIADALCQEGIWAYAPETFVENDTVQVRFVNYRGISQEGFVMGFADAIVIERQGQPIGTLARWISDGADAVAKGLRFDGEAPSQEIPTLV